MSGGDPQAVRNIFLKKRTAKKNAWMQPKKNGKNKNPFQDRKK